MSVTNRVRTCVFPVAGLGTRMLPATKSLPKEMLPVVDKPIVQYALEEAAEAGIEKFIFVTGRGKSMIEDHFDRAFELFQTLREKAKVEALQALEDELTAPGCIAYTRQQEPKGLGHAVWCARHLVEDDAFAVSLVDDLILGQSCLAELADAHAKTGGNVLALMAVPEDDTSKYGIIDPGHTSGTMTEIKGMVEKPDRGTAPSSLAVVGRYILSRNVFSILDRQERGAGGEIQLTDAMMKLVGTEPFHGVAFSGQRHDCGDKLGYLQAIMSAALQRDDLRDGMKQIVRDLYKSIEGHS